MPFILTTRDGKCYWRGPGLHPIRSLSLRHLPYWETLAEAKAVAHSLKAALGLDLRPVRFDLRHR